MLPRVWTPAQVLPERAVRSIPENAPEGPTRRTLVRVQVGELAELMKDVKDG